MLASLGYRLREARENMGWSQTYVCKKLNIPNSTLSGYERDYREPDVETLAKLAELYEVTTDYLSGLTDDPKGSVASADSDTSVSPEEREFLEWVKEHVTGTFFYDFHQSPDERKADYMKGLRLIYELEKGRKLGPKQGE